ncbi:MAG TPA: helix-turn-helix domain-containing protein [Novosphingobium sp.]|nr:helix-turn-helix domain-containing protein [Novosphingobium sp.]
MARPQTDLEAGREQLLDITVELIEERGTAGLTVTDIAARAGMSPASLYRYFDSKEAVIEAVAERWQWRKRSSLRTCLRAARCSNSTPAASPI